MKMGSALVLTKADEVLAEIEEAAKHDFLPIVGPVKGKILARTVRDAKPRRVLEVGPLIGYSAILMVKSLTKYGNNVDRNPSRRSKIS